MGRIRSLLRLAAMYLASKGATALLPPTPHATAARLGNMQQNTGRRNAATALATTAPPSSREPGAAAYDFEAAATQPHLSTLLFFAEERDSEGLKPLKPFFRPPFLPSLLSAIVLAAINPTIGRTGGPLMPEITVNLVGVSMIFFISGMSLRLSQIADAAFNFRANCYIQAFGYAVFPALFWLLTTALRGVADPRLLDGLLVLGCLPTSINMCVVLTSRANGDLALSIFNAVVSNALGVFVTPVLLLALLGKTLSLPLAAVLSKLFRRVILPLVLGLAMRRWDGARRAFDRRRAYASLTSELLLVGVVYSTFCDAFGAKGVGAATAAGGGSVALGSLALLAALPLLYGVMAASSWLISRRVLRLSAREAVAAVYVSSHKTLAMGIPLIRTVFEGSPDIGWLSAPLLVWHPAQVIWGSFASTYLQRVVASEPPPPPEPVEGAPPPKPEYVI